MCVALVSPNNALASKQFGVAFGINRRVANGRINRFVTHEALNQPQVCPSIYQVRFSCDAYQKAAKLIGINAIYWYLYTLNEDKTRLIEFGRYANERQKKVSVA
jgi:hypothetical protein